MPSLIEKGRRLLRARARVVDDVRAAYRLWAPCYPPHAHNPFMIAEQRAVEACLPRLHGCAALDVGTGSGRYLPVLESAGARLVVGVDLSWAMLTRGQRTMPRACCDGLHLPFPASSFDFVLCSLVVPDVANLRGWALEVARVLCPGGRLLYSDLHPVWAAQRWRRTLTTPSGRTFVIPYHSRSPSQHCSVLAAAGLAILDIREPCLDGSRTSAPSQGSPVALVISARKIARRSP